MTYKIFKNIKENEVEAVANKFGSLIEYGVNGEKLIDIIPGKSRTPNTLTTRYAYGSFPYHTDTAYWHNPAKFVLLYCKSPGSGLRPTKILEIESYLKESQFYNTAKDAVFLVKRKFKSFFAKAYQIKQGQLEFRFDKDCMIPKNKSASKLIDIFSNICDSNNVITHNWEKGDLLLINNHKSLHSRGESKSKDSDRILTRGLIR